MRCLHSSPHRSGAVSGGPREFGLLSHDRGALSLAGIFMTLMLVTMLYMVVGFGRTLYLREGMQDAADAAAYSSAIFHARGMNLIALINLIMAALIAVLIAMRMVQTLFAIAATALGAAGIVSFGLAAPLAAFCTSQVAAFQGYYTQAKNIIDPTLRALHTTQEAISVVVPWVAMAEGMNEAATYHPPAHGAFALPGAISLPVESDEFSLLCGMGGRFAAELALAPFTGFFPKPLRPVHDKLVDAAEGMSTSMSGYLCGDGSGSPPTHTQKYEEGYPKPHGTDECAKDPEAYECELLKQEVEEARPGADGECTAAYCSYKDPYEMYARKARLDCEPREGNVPSKYTWQRRTGTADFVWDGNEWRLVQRKRTNYLALEETTLPPCGHPLAIVDPEQYDRHSGEPDQAEPDPLCRVETIALERAPDPGYVVADVAYDEATRIFGCTFERYKTHEVANKEDTFGGGGEDKSPHKVEDDVHLGDEAFQIRALAYGERPDPGRKSKDAALLLARSEKWNDGARGFVAEIGQQLGRFSIAQSEYYFQGPPVPSAEWLWKMNWSARLKHFHLPTEDEQEEEEQRLEESASKNQSKVATFGGLSPMESATDACKMAGGEKCDGAADSTRAFDRWVRH